MSKNIVYLGLFVTVIFFQNCSQHSWDPKLNESTVSPMESSAAPFPGSMDENLAKVSVASTHSSLWATTSHIPKLTALGNMLGLSCHNCFGSSLSGTKNKIEQALRGSADLIELDVSFIQGDMYVNSSDPVNLPAGGLPLLSDVLSISRLQSGDEIIFLEIKENSLSESQASQLINLLAAKMYLNSTKRPIVLRSFYNTPLVNLQKAMAKNNFSGRVILSKLFYQVKSQDIVMAKASGFEMVELALNIPELHNLLSLAKNLRLYTNIYTIQYEYELHIARFRNLADVLTIESGSSTEKIMYRSAAIAQNDNDLIYMDLGQNEDARSLSIYDAVSGDKSYDLSAPAMPRLLPNSFSGSGSHLLFSKGQNIPLPDLDNPKDGGFFVSVVASFKSSQVPAWTTQVLLGKADSSGFSLEVQKLNPNTPTMLRFAVYVNGAYRIAYKPIEGIITPGVSYNIIASYSGSGTVRLFVDSSGSGMTPSESVKGGVVQNDSPVRIGADPQGKSAARSYFDGTIQHISLQKWTTQGGLPRSANPESLDSNWVKRHNNILAMDKSRAELVFIGDSITDEWDEYGKDVWDYNYAKYNALNLGIWGDRTQNVLWRIQNGELEGSDPKLVVLMIGTNNTKDINGDGGDSAEDIATGIKTIINTVKAKLPNSKILVLKIFPRGYPNDYRRLRNDQASELVEQAIAQDGMVIYRDINSSFMGSTGYLKDGYRSDLLHFNNKGYQYWSKAIAPIINDILGN